MDTTVQRHEIEAQDWQRGLYEDVKRTFRAPFVNWIFRTTMANYPDVLRYVWGQVKPIFDTRAFARYSVEYRDGVLSAIEDSFDLSTYRRGAIDTTPSAYRELRGQLATFDVVAPRLAALFAVCDRALHGESVGSEPAEDRAATAPFPEWLDTERGTPPTMVEAGEAPAELDAVIEAVRTFHGLDGGLPSIYRCLAQWPTFLESAWDDLEPVFESDAFERAREATDERRHALAAATPYRPRLAPDDLRGVGFDDETIEDVQQLFREFNRGAIPSVLPAIHLYATTVDAVGVREFP